MMEVATLLEFDGYINFAPALTSVYPITDI